MTDAPDTNGNEAPATTALIAGCGYVGTRLGVREVTDGLSVTATTRDPDRFAELANLGMHPFQLDLDGPPNRELAGRAQDSLIYYLVPPQSQGEDDARATRFLQALEDARPRKIVLLSTTAVYGDCEGAWVDELTPANPQSSRGRRRYDSEQRFQRWAERNEVPLVVLRVAGIYGPGRLPRARLARGEPVLEPGLSPYSNRIHADDLVSVCRAAARTPQAFALYNVADGSPSNMTDYFFRVADALGIARPPTLDFAAARETLSEGMMSYLRESKRIDSSRLLEELGVRLRFPDLESGLMDAVGGAGSSAKAPKLVVCVNDRIDATKPSCAGRGSEALAAKLGEEIARRGLPAELKKVYCLGRCERGPNLRIAPGGKMYFGVTEADFETVLEDLARACENDRARG